MPKSLNPRRPVAAGCSFGLLLSLVCCPAFPAASEEIIPKILVGEETNAYESVGIVGSLDAGGFCTGTLISSTDVLTAAHCAEVIRSSDRGTFEVDGVTVTSAAVFIHPDYNSFTLENDIAILRLSEPIVGVEPSPIFRGTPLVGDVLSIVGFGGTGTATEGNDGSFGTKRVGITTIDNVTDTLVEWLYDDPAESNTASGDSGGPGFLLVDGVEMIACITSGGTVLDSTLGDLAFNTRVDAYAGWIDTTLMEPAPANDGSDDGDDVGGDTSDEPEDVIAACDGYLSQPFPFLSFLIDLLTSLLESLTATEDTIATEPDSVEPASPAESEAANPRRRGNREDVRRGGRGRRR
ncbi:MAG: trypsin-like serine protease [Planctomycetota bacterium]